MFNLHSSKHTIINWKIIENSDLIFITPTENHYLVNFVKLVEQAEHYKQKPIIKIQFDTKETAIDCINRICEYKETYKAKKLKELEYKIDEIYYMPSMPGFVHSKNSFEQNL